MRRGIDGSKTWAVEARQLPKRHGNRRDGLLGAADIWGENRRARARRGRHRVPHHPELAIVAVMGAAMVAAGVVLASRPE